MKAKHQLIRSNTHLALSTWGPLSRSSLSRLKGLTERYSFSIALGDIQLLDQSWYITHAGLLRLSERRHCHGVEVSLVRRVCDPLTRRWVFKATVYRSPNSRGFVGYGDADPSNVSSVVRGAEMRIAETRAVNRALRKAYGIGLCSVEELGWSPRVPDPPNSDQQAFIPNSKNGNGNGSCNGQPRLRDRLCLLVRKYQLDSALVKSYAADFCGTETLRDAGRDLVETFVNNLAEWAAKDRDGLLCKLNSYSPSKEVSQ